MKHFETRAVHAGHHTQDAQGAVKPALHRASTFAFPSAQNGADHMEAAYGVPGVTAPDSGYIYSRLHNPTIAAAETRLAALVKQVESQTAMATAKLTAADQFAGAMTEARKKLEALEAEYQKLKSAAASTTEPTKTAANN